MPHRDESTEEISREAARWIVQLSESGATADRVAFTRWLRRSPVHVREYLRAEVGWEALRHLDGSVPSYLEAGELRPMISSVVSLPITGETLHQRGDSTAVSTLRHRSRSVALIAALLLVVVLTAFLFLSHQRSTNTILQTARGEQRTLSLHDGSIVEINTQSELAVSFSANSRDVDLRTGEAFFHVAKDPSRPFRVFAHGVQIKAVGTQFTVCRCEGKTIVSVLEGVVEVRDARIGNASPEDHSRHQDEIALGVGDQAILKSAIWTRNHSVDAVQRANAWRARRLIADRDSLDDVIAQMNRYNVRQIVVRGNFTDAPLVSGVFDVDRPDIVVKYIADSHLANVEESIDRGWLVTTAK